MARTTKRKGAVVLVLSESQDQCLAISRDRNTEDWNLPGGHVEHGESVIEAAVRELYEETGILVTKSNIRPVHKSGTTTMFLAMDFFRWPQQLRSEPFEGYVSWKPLMTLCRPCCTFHQHHRDLFGRLGLMRNMPVRAR